MKVSGMCTEARKIKTTRCRRRGRNVGIYFFKGGRGLHARVKNKEKKTLPRPTIFAYLFLKYDSTHFRGMTRPRSPQYRRKRQEESETMKSAPRTEGKAAELHPGGVVLCPEEISE